MVQSDKWTERFRISAKDLSQAQTLESTGDPLRWCLMNGKIPEIEYLEWAMSHFELPSINSDFFTAPPDHAFWNRVKDMHPWHEGFFPVTEWEGTLLIACISPREDFTLAQPHKFVLASARHLLLLWNHLNPEAAAGIPKSIDFGAELDHAATKNSLQSEDSSAGMEMPDGFFLNPTTTVSNSQSAKGDVDFGALFPAPIAVSAESVAVTAPAENSFMSEMPEGFSSAGFELGPAASSAAKLDSASDLFSETSSTSSASFVLEVPENIILEKPQKKAEVPSEAARLKEIETLTKRETKAPEKVIAKADVTPPTPVHVQVSMTPPPLPPKVKAAAPTPAKVVAEEETATATVADVLVTDAPVVEEQIEAPSDVSEDNTGDSSETSTDTRFALSNVSLRPLDATVSQDDLGAVSLGHILSNFNGAMVLIMEDGILKPWKWSDLLTTPKSSDLNSILLDKPSIFRIVYRTRLPYHGYVRPSEVTSAFFDAYQNGRLPPHVTLVPVVVQGEVYAMLLGILVKGEGTRSMLSQMESLADDFARKLTETRRNTAA